VSRQQAPNLDRLAILDDDGRRKKVQPADVDGRFQRWKPFVRWALIGFFVALPWIEIGGHPAVLFDLPARRFHLFGLVLGTGDLPFLFFLLIIGAWGLVVVTALFGRVWCGWACPQTVYLEAVFRRIERALEGNGAARLAFDMAPWSASKVARKALKWSAWLVASFVIAHVFLSYFVSLPRVVTMVQDAPREHWGTFLVAAFATGITYFNFAWFREQTCLIICPYGRLQSTLQDKDSIVIGYDRARGEPRGKRSADNQGAGDCVDCRRCVVVCPTGIDIRNGLQMECIGCAACVDACDDVMSKLHRPRGLVRYDSERALTSAGDTKKRFVRPRTAGYALIGFALLCGLAAFTVLSVPLVARVTRPPGMPWILMGDQVQNTAFVHVENRSSVARVVAFDVSLPLGAVLVSAPTTVHLEPQARADLPVVVSARRTALPARVDIELHDDVGARSSLHLDVLGPATSGAR
jgi:cytochrome c oxidase accessory protein FixG